MPPGNTAFRPMLRATHRANTMTTQVAVAAAIAGIGAYALYTRSSSAKSDKPIFSSFGFHTLRLESTEVINHNTKKLRFELPDASKPAGLTLTSALLTISFPKGRWFPVLRPYTPTNEFNEPGYIDLMIKLYPNGKQSTHLHSLKPGDTLTVAGPIKGFAWTPNKHPHVALIAGGAGITPMYQLARGILQNPDDRTRVTLVWGVNMDDDIFLREEFAELETKYPGRFKATYVVASPQAGSRYQRGFVSKEVLEGAGLGAEEEKNRDIKVLVCGPPAMEKALKGKVSGVLAQLGYKSEQIHTF